MGAPAPGTVHPMTHPAHPPTIAAMRAPAPVADWLQACRVNSLAISTVAVGVGAAAALADGRWSGLVVPAWLGAVLIQAGTNLANVHYNYKSAAGSADSSGTAWDPIASSAVVRSGRLSPALVRRGALACFAAGAVLGLAIAALAGWRILALGVPAVLAGWFYAAPPVRLAYRGLGVATVFVFMGPVMVLGTYYVAARAISPGAVAASIAVGLVAAGVMHTNDLRDYAGDVAHGKRTLAVRLGRARAIAALPAIGAAAFLTIFAAAAAGLLPATVLAVALALPLAAAQARLARDASGPAGLHEAWLCGVRLHGAFGALLVAGLLAGPLFR